MKSEGLPSRRGLVRLGARRMLGWVLVLAIALGMTPLALAKSKKVEKEAAPEKSYVMPYMIVIAMVSLGLMTVCRPGSRLDKPPDDFKKDPDN